MDYFYLILGFIALLLSGNYLVKSSVSLANHLNVSTLVIGIVIVSFGTSAPELVISAKAAVEGHPDIAIGNVLGSNIANIALVLALSAMIIRIPIKKNTLRIDWPVMMFATLLFLAFVRDLVFSAFEGMIFVLFLVAYVLLSFKKAKIDARKESLVSNNPEYKIVLSIVILIGSCLGLVLGANWLINSVTSIAQSYGVSERVISLTVVAFGTSLPELATSVIAAAKKELDISVGNIIGSNIFNLFAVVGVSGIISDIKISPDTLSFDIWWVIGIAVALFIICLPLKKPFLNWWKGIILLLAYFYYVYLLF